MDVYVVSVDGGDQKGWHGILSWYGNRMV
jgi:hypothetical protein